MTFKSPHTGKEIRLLDCPFCGAEPKLRYIGNNFVKKRSIEVKCPNCRIKRTDSALRHGFDRLEDVAMKGWNQRRL